MRVCEPKPPACRPASAVVLWLAWCVGCPAECLPLDLAGDWVAWVGTWDDLEQGRDGQYRVRLLDNKHRWDCASPGVEVLPAGTIVTTTYGHWQEGEPPYIMCVRLGLAELDAKAGGGG